MNRPLLTCMFALPLLAPLAAAAEFDPAQRAEAIAPYVHEEALVILRVDLERVNVKATFELVEKIIGEGFPGGPLEGGRQLLEFVSRLRDWGAEEVLVTVGVGDVMSGRLAIIVPLAEGAKEEFIREALGTLARGMGGGRGAEQATCARLKDAVYCGSPATFESLKESDPPARPGLEEALAAAGDTAAQLLFAPTADQQRVIRELGPSLPQPLRGDADERPLSSVRWAAAGFDFPPKPELKVTIAAENEDAAKALEAIAVRGLTLLAQVPDVREISPKLDEFIRMLAPQAQGDRLELTIGAEEFDRAGELLARPVGAARATAERQASMQNLRQLALAFHNFADQHRSFPPAASYDKEGKPLLSWRVFVLPYVEQGNLYEQFHLDEPWDSEHNKKLIEMMPPVFATPGLKEKGKTAYLAPVGDNTAVARKVGVSFTEITDGTSNTIMLVEAAPEHAVIWTKPDDIQIDLEKPHAMLTGGERKGFLAALCDGSIQFISSDIAAETLRRLFQRDDGEPVGDY